MRHVSASQQELVIRTIARIPLPMARRDFLTRLEPRLTRKMTDEQVVEAINATLASFPPGAYQIDSAGRVFRAGEDRITPTTSLKEAADIYQRTLRDDPGSWSWPPHPPRPPRPSGQAPETKPLSGSVEMERHMTPEQCRAAAEEYQRTLSNWDGRRLSDEEWEEHKRRKANEEAERLAVQARWPVDPSSPPSEAAQLIRGEVIPEPEPEPDPDPDDEPPHPPRDPAPTRSQAIRETIELIRRRGKGRPRKPPGCSFAS